MSWIKELHAFLFLGRAGHVGQKDLILHNAILFVSPGVTVSMPEEPQEEITMLLGEIAAGNEAANLLETVAQAVHHAHQRRVLHNDLKPGNILLDEEGKPHVTDFGLAMRLGEEASSSASGAIAGTASFMSPEQAAGDRELTTASDVYELGAVLYALLTSRPPFQGETVQETLRLVREELPEPPSNINPNVDRELEAICLKCLSKDKDQRYASANALARDLARYQAGEETIALPLRRRERFVRWRRRNPVLASLVAAVGAISILAIVMALSFAQARKGALLKAALESNRLAAKDLATTALLQLGSLSRSVEMAVADERLAVLLARDDRPGLQPILDDMCSGQPSPFASCYIVDADAILVAHATNATDVIDVIGLNVAWRD